MKIRLIIAALLIAGAVQAELVGSLHIDATLDIQNLDVIGPVATRTINGDVNTRGTVGGLINFLAASPGEGISDIRANAANTVNRDLNRFGDNANGGSVVTYDYNFTGLSSDEWNFHLDFTAEGAKPAGHTLGFYISYTDGASLTLDTTDIKLETPGATALVTGNTAEYISLLDIDPTATAGVINVDITSIVNTAIANGGGIRIAFVDNTFQNNIKYWNDSGIQAIPEPATLGLLAVFGGGILFMRRRFKS